MVGCLKFLRIGKFEFHSFAETLVSMLFEVRAREQGRFMVLVGGETLFRFFRIIAVIPKQQILEEPLLVLADDSVVGVRHGDRLAAGDAHSERLYVCLEYLTVGGVPPCPGGESYAVSLRSKVAIRDSHVGLCEGSLIVGNQKKHILEYLRWSPALLTGIAELSECSKFMLKLRFDGKMMSFVDVPR